MSAVDVTDAFEGLETPQTGVRTPGAFVSGRWVFGTPVALSFQGVLQSATAKDLLVLEEGNRSTESIKIHTKFDLVPQIEGLQTGDLISYRSLTWLVFSVAYRAIGAYNKAIALRQ